MLAGASGLSKSLANIPVVGKPFDSVGTTRTVSLVTLKLVVSQEVDEQIKRDVDVLRNYINFVAFGIPVI